MSELRCRMIADMKLHGLAPGTQKVYLSAVERLAQYYQRSPEQLSEQDLREYFSLTELLRPSMTGILLMRATWQIHPILGLHTIPSLRPKGMLDPRQAQRLSSNRSGRRRDQSKSK